MGTFLLGTAQTQAGASGQEEADGSLSGASRPQKGPDGGDSTSEPIALPADQNYGTITLRGTDGEPVLHRASFLISKDWNYILSYIQVHINDAA